MSYEEVYQRIPLTPTEEAEAQAWLKVREAVELFGIDEVIRRLKAEGGHCHDCQQRKLVAADCRSAAIATMMRDYQ